MWEGFKMWTMGIEEGSQDGGKERGRRGESSDPGRERGEGEEKEEEAPTSTTMMYL